jgi:hypothetical protein
MEWLARVGGFLTALVAAGALLGFTRAQYRKTFGRRRDRYGRLARLGTNAQVSFFSSGLGEPPAMRPNGGSRRHSIRRGRRRIPSAEDVDGVRLDRP